MDGLGWLIKNALAASGVEIKPEEITKTIETAKVLIPRVAEQFQFMVDRQIVIERKLDTLLALNNMPTVEDAKKLHPGSEVVAVPVPKTVYRGDESGGITHA